MPSLAAASASLTYFPAAAPMENAISMETQNSSSSSSLRSSFSSPFFKLRSFPLRAFRILAMAFTSVLSIATAAFGLRQLPWTWLSAGKDATEAVEEEEEQEEEEREDERREAEEQQQQQQQEENSQTNNDSKVQPSLPLLWFPRFGRSVKEINEVQIRRDLALQPTLEDPDTERRVVPFVNSRGQTIFTQSWTPAAPDHPVKGIVVLIHGLNEHSGRYAQFAMQLNSQGYGVFGMDWIGHGGSDGLHGYVQSLDHVVSDAKEYCRRVAAEYPGIPCFLFGHSTGGAIALKVALQPDMEKELQGVVVSSAAVKVKPAHPVIGAVAPLFSVLLPRYQFRGANRRLAVCRDPAALVAKYTDPLVYTGPIRIRTGTEILRLSRYLLKSLSNVSIPLLVLHGSDDQVTDPKGSQELHDRASSKHKHIILYAGLLHDILFEAEKEEITEDIIRWLNERLSQLESCDEATLSSS